MIKTLITIALLISIYDVPHDQKHVIVEICQNPTLCTDVRVNRSDLDDPSLVSRLANLIELLDTQ